MMNDELPELAPIVVPLVSLIHHSSFLIHRFSQMPAARHRKRATKGSISPTAF
jgi:hypothetical protein